MGATGGAAGNDGRDDAADLRLSLVQDDLPYRAQRCDRPDPGEEASGSAAGRCCSRC